MALVHPHRHLTSYVHNGRVGVLVEFGCASDFTVRTPEFESLARAIALQIAAMAPRDVDGLYGQEYVKDPLRTVGEHLREVGEALQEQIDVTRFIRWSADDESDGLPSTPGPDRDPPRTPGVILAFGGVRRSA